MARILSSHHATNSRLASLSCSHAKALSQARCLERERLVRLALAFVEVSQWVEAGAGSPDHQVLGQTDSLVQLGLGAHHHTSLVGCRPPLALLLVRPAPQVLPHPARGSRLHSVVLQTVATGLLLLSSSLVSLASLHWAPCRQAPLPLVMAHLLVHPPHSRARHRRDPSLLVPRAQSGPLWLWLHPHTCPVLRQVDRRLLPMSTLHSSPRLATTTCHPTTAEGLPDQTTHTDARRHMREGNMVLEAGRWRHRGHR